MSQHSSLCHFVAEICGDLIVIDSQKNVGYLSRGGKCGKAYSGDLNIDGKIILK
jgi:hypothetical protein